MDQARDGNSNMKDALLGQISGLSIPISLTGEMGEVVKEECGMLTPFSSPFQCTLC